MSYPISQSEVGSVYQLDTVDPESLKKLGEELLVGMFGHFCVGIEPTGGNHPKRLKEIEDTDLIKHVHKIIASELWTTFMGVEVIGNQLSSVIYRRPLADDAPREENKQNLLKNVLHTQLPLFDNILVGLGEAGRKTVEPGQVFVPHFSSQYDVMVPPDAVNMEIVFAKDFQATRDNWVAYMDAQPRPVH